MKEALGELLKREQNPTAHNYSNLLGRTVGKLAGAGIIDSNSKFENLGSGDPLASLLVEGYQQLLISGYIIPRPGQTNPPLNPFFLTVTDLGRRWIENSDPIPEDPQGYRAALLTLVPQVDPVIRQYVEEALLTYQQRALFASAVMIGAASEKAVYLLMEALQGAVSDPAKKRAIQKLINQERSLPKIFKQLADAIQRAKNSGVMPYSVHEGADFHLISLQEAIRVQRNDAVHPQVGQVELETVRLALSAFPAVYKKAYDLTEWFNNNPDSL